MNSIQIQGSEEQVYQKLVELGIGANRQDANKLIKTLSNHNQLLGPDEYVRKDLKLSSGKSIPGACYLMTPSFNYYISVKFTTIMLAATISDIVLTKGFASLATGLLGLSNQGIVKMNEKNGEKCIVKQTALSKDKIGSQDILSENKGKCCNKDFKCQYNVEGTCRCDFSDIITIYENLTQKGVFKQQGECYKFNL